MAAPVPGFVGFAVGRTLWWEPLRYWIDGMIDREEAVDRIAANYRRLCAVYVAAAGQPGRRPAVSGPRRSGERRAGESR
jgi:myo-inositol catabolism protein IolC